MGAGSSKEELVYMAVQRGDLAGIRALRQQGASLEFRDSKGRTPLMLACSRPESFEAAHTLLQLGADMRAYSKGLEGGCAIHYAARKKLSRTMEMLLNYGADPLQRNEMGRSALDLAREQHLAPMVRLIESRVGLFAGLMRQHLLSNSILKVLVPQWVSRIVWVAVVPLVRGSPGLQLAIYPTADAGMPTTTLLLQEHSVSMTKQDTTDPKCVIQSNRTGEKYKFGSEPPDQPAVVFRFYNACNGIHVSASPGGPYGPPAGSPHYPPPGYPAQPVANPGPPQPASPQPAPAPATPTSAPAAVKGAASLGAAAAGDPTRIASFQSTELSDEEALKRALEESMRSAPGERSGSSSSFNGWSAPSAGHATEPTYGGWGDPVPAGAAAAAAAARPTAARPTPEPVTAEGRAAMSSWAGAAPPAGDGAFGGWGTSGQASPAVPAGSAPAAAVAGPSAAAAQAAHGAPSAHPAAGAPASAPAGAAPSAPPLPAGGLYPSIDTSPVLIDYSAVTAVDPSPANQPPPQVNPAYSEARVKEELKKAEDKKGGGQCVICWDAPAEAVCVPCGHLAGCMECLTEVKAKEWGCPVCRAKIDTVMKVFQV